MASADPVERVSRIAALVVTAGLAALAIGLATAHAPPETPAVDEPSSVSLLTGEPAPAEASPRPAPPPADVPRPVQPAPPKPRAVAPPVAAPSPSPAVDPTPPPLPRPPPRAATPAAVEPRPPESPVAAPPPRVSNQAQESNYLGRVRSYIRSITAYPNRDETGGALPEGTTVLRFALSRDGGVSHVRVVSSSRSAILDDQAVTIVQRGGFPAWPDDAWPGSDEREFTITIDFVAPKERD